MQMSPFLRLAALLGFYSLDIFDLYVKVVWIGPPDSFSFYVDRELGFDHEALPKPVFSNPNESNSEKNSNFYRVSGWTSLYQRCRDLYAPINSRAFDVVMGTDCDLGSLSSTKSQISHNLILSASSSVDSVAWVSCQLLFFHRRPPICQENLVTFFAQRYRLTEAEVDPDNMAPIHSIAEAELLRLLNLLSNSHPLTNVICAQGFEYTAGPGHYHASVFVCNSPNGFESSFIGASLTTFAELHDNLAHLAVSKVDIMGFELISRKNSRSHFILQEKAGDVIVKERNNTNFSTFGHLYVILILVDVTLLIAHIRAAFEAARMFGWKSLLGFQKISDNERDVLRTSRWLQLYRSLYRSEYIIGLTIVSALDSWLVNLPFDFMWCTDHRGKAYAIVSTIRISMLVISLLNLIWSAFVRISEARAYRIVKYTYVSPLEILLALGFIATLQTPTLFNGSIARRQLEDQHGVDNESFYGWSALWNSYDEEIDRFCSTSPYTIGKLLAPLSLLITQTLALIFVLLVGKFMYFSRLRDRQHNVNASEFSVIESDDIDKHLEGYSVERYASSTPLMTRHSTESYHRLPLEDLMRTPARANSLVRCCFDLDMVEADGLTYMLPHVYFDFGIVISDAGYLRSRRRFNTVLRRRLDIEKFVVPQYSSSSIIPSPLKRQRIEFEKAVKRAKFALNNEATHVEALINSIITPLQTQQEQKSMATSKYMRRRKSMDELLIGASPTSDVIT